MRYKDGNIRVMLESNCGLVEILVLKFLIPKHARMVYRYAMKLEHDLFLIVFLMSGGRGRAMVFSYQSIPLGACILVLCFDG